LKGAKVLTKPDHVKVDSQYLIVKADTTARHADQEAYRNQQLMKTLLKE
jgi:hypothetical protein